MPNPELARSSGVRYAVLIMWPAFLAACLLEGLVFGLVDPAELHWPGRFAEPDRLSVYTAAFFAFWLIGMASSALVLWLAGSVPAIRGTRAE